MLATPNEVVNAAALAQVRRRRHGRKGYTHAKHNSLLGAAFTARFRVTTGYRDELAGLFAYSVSGLDTGTIPCWPCVAVACDVGAPCSDD